MEERRRRVARRCSRAWDAIAANLSVERTHSTAGSAHNAAPGSATSSATSAAQNSEAPLGKAARKPALHAVADELTALAVDGDLPASHDGIAFVHELAAQLRAAHVRSIDELTDVLERTVALVRMVGYGLEGTAANTEVFALRSKMPTVFGRRATTSDGGTEKIRVLVVDDSALIRDILTTELRNGGFTVESVSSLAAFASTQKTFVPHVVVCDCNLTDGKGDSLCRVIKRDHQGVAVVMMSTIPEAELEERAFAAGADRYIGKREGAAAIAAAVTELADELVL
jgi:CheY-like chemotaxis protein